MCAHSKQAWQAVHQNWAWEVFFFLPLHSPSRWWETVGYEREKEWEIVGNRYKCDKGKAHGRQRTAEWKEEGEAGGGQRCEMRLKRSVAASARWHVPILHLSSCSAFYSKLPPNITPLISHLLLLFISAPLQEKKLLTTLAANRQLHPTYRPFKGTRSQGEEKKKKRLWDSNHLPGRRSLFGILEVLADISAFSAVRLNTYSAACCLAPHLSSHCWAGSGPIWFPMARLQ